MGEKALDVFEGQDWLTYRWSVAEMFDALDRVREVCQMMPLMGESLMQMPGIQMPRYEMSDTDEPDVSIILAELCDDLSGSLDAVQADLFPYLQNDVTHRWMAFEMQLHLNNMKQIIIDAQVLPEPSHTMLDDVASYAERIRGLLKQIDQ